MKKISVKIPKDINVKDPLTAVELSKILGCHRSTITRAVNKGIVSLRNDKIYLKDNVIYISKYLIPNMKHMTPTQRSRATALLEKLSGKKLIKGGVKTCKKKGTIDTQKIWEESALAKKRKVIFESRIAEAKAQQEEIKTLQLTKELAPISMMKHWFSFLESLIQEIYQTPKYISPILESLYCSGETKEAEMRIIRELEAVVKRTHAAMIEEMEEEGFKYKKKDG